MRTLEETQELNELLIKINTKNYNRNQMLEDLRRIIILLAKGS